MTVQTTTETVKAPKPAELPERTFRVVTPILPGRSGLVRVTEVSGKRRPRIEADTYAISVGIEDVGLVAAILKTSRTVNGVPAPVNQTVPYHTVIGGGEDSCDCWAGLRYGTCRHCSLLHALVEQRHLTEGGGE